jgi:predicted dinucleotide-binding enzyme
MNPAVTRIGVLGAGHVGPVIARLGLAAGFEVAIAASGDADILEMITSVVIPGAQARRAEDAVGDADITVLAIPLHRFFDLDPVPLEGKLVIDAMNYWPATDGSLPRLQDSSKTSSEIVAQRLDRATIVKTLNHIGYQDLERFTRPAGSANRYAMGVAGDDGHAVTAISEFLDKIGYEPTPVGSLADSRVLEPGGPVFGAVLTRTDFDRAVRAAQRQAHARELPGLNYGQRA